MSDYLELADTQQGSVRVSTTPAGLICLRSQHGCNCIDHYLVPGQVLELIGWLQQESITKAESHQSEE